MIKKCDPIWLFALTFGYLWLYIVKGGIIESSISNVSNLYVFFLLPKKGFSNWLYPQLTAPRRQTHYVSTAQHPLISGQNWLYALNQSRTLFTNSTQPLPPSTVRRTHIHQPVRFRALCVWGLARPVKYSCSIAYELTKIVGILVVGVLPLVSHFNHSCAFLKIHVQFPFSRPLRPKYIIPR